MVFASLFFVFTFITLYMWLYLGMPTVKGKNIVLLCFSLVFYTWGEPVYIALMVGSVFVNYLFGLAIGRCFHKDNRKRARLFLILDVIFNLAVIGVFKYTDFLLLNVDGLFGLNITPPGIILPLGISFFTFQIMSYVIDVYRKQCPAQKSFWKLLLYLSSFHQLVAGPIVRYVDVANEIEDRRIHPDELTAGIMRFLTGLAKKAVLANTCGALSKLYMDNPNLEAVPVLGAWFGLILYSAQIYFDFSAYSDMALGMGWMSGFHYKENFLYPYTAKSVTDFWRKWHISLSSFFRDYVYIPLGGNRKHQYFNIFVVWFLTGLWHGASWNFVFWGLYFCIFLILEKRFFKKILDKLPASVGHAYLLIIVVFSWVLFYFTDLNRMFSFLKTLFGLNGNPFSTSTFALNFQNNVFFFLLVLIALFPVSQILKKHLTQFGNKNKTNYNIATGIMVVTCVALLATSVISLVGDSFNPFLYFRF